MSNENHNNWKNKLGELSSLPEENPFDRNASWDKLHARMGEKKQSKKAVWYWAAAACILFALMIPVMIFNKKTDHIANVETKQKPPGANNSVALGIDKSDSVINTNPVLSEKKEGIVAGKLKKTQNKTPENKINKVRLYDTVSLKNLVTVSDKNSLEQADTLSYAIKIIFPEKKKLKVVQINELGNPEESQPGVVRNTDKHLFQFKFGNQEIYANPSLASADKGFTILKIKTSSN